MTNKIIIDGDFLIYRVVGNKNLLDIPEEYRLNNCISKLESLMQQLFIQTNADSYIGYLTRGRNFRYTIDPQYKANRKNTPKPEYFIEIRDYLILHYKFICVTDIEADDACLITYNSRLDDNTLIVAVDKDIIKCKPVRYFNPSKYELGIQTTSLEDAELCFWKSMIVGDPGDNIKGLKGKGEVFANKLLNVEPLDITKLSVKVYEKYIEEYQCNILGSISFTKTFNLLYILDTDDSFVISEYNKILKEEIQYNQNNGTNTTGFTEKEDISTFWD